MDYLMAHPIVQLGDVAKHFGVTQSWLSCIIHSDIFQAGLREKQGIVFHHTVLPLREKITMAAHLAMDRLIDTLPMETEPKAVSDIAGNLLERLGFGTKVPAVQINNTQLNVMRSEVEEARELLGRAQRPGVVIDGERAPIGLALPAPRSAGVGETDSLPAFSPFEAEFSGG